MKLLTIKPKVGTRISLLGILCAMMIQGCRPDSDARVLKASLSYTHSDDIENLIDEMTLEEKVGQLNFLYSGLVSTGPSSIGLDSKDLEAKVREGEVTGFFNMYGAAITGKLQRIAVEESRLGIPLIFGADVIHGFRTTFPIPLGSAASWDLEAIEASARVAAEESTAVGINLNFAPMVDISRDARWGRTAEGAGEDPYLGGKVAAARIRGYQGDDLSAPNTFAACVKHFAAYGAPVAGREYNTVDMSEIVFRETYLRPYQAGIAAGAATVMTSFNDLNGIPASGNVWLLRDILRGELGFEGLTVSDWQSVGEMIAHSYSPDSLHAAEMGMKAGTDLDMMSEIYLKHVPTLVRDGKLDESYLDEAVRRVLQLKYDLGLFEDPYRYSNLDREAAEIFAEDHRATAREMARKSVVLLQNRNQVLPLSTSQYKTIAVIGPLADARADMNGTWSFFSREDEPITLLEGIKARVGDSAQVLYSPGCELDHETDEHFEEAVRMAKEADVVILAIGEPAIMNGEAASRADIGLPGNQQALAKRIAATGTPTVALVSSGRALTLSWEAENLDAIMAIWTLGTESGTAAADVLFGDYNPSGKLPVTFPRQLGQVPLYYNHKTTGRPYEGDHSEPYNSRVYYSRYLDVPNSPLWPFGHGLSYTSYEYSDLKVSQPSIAADESLEVSVRVRNTGARKGTETVQLYIRDLFGSVTRPVRELKGFEQITLQPGESKVVTFTVGPEQLSFWRADMTYGVEPGDFEVYAGGNSQATLKGTFEVISDNQ